jgi:hypothetical protein
MPPPVKMKAKPKPKQIPLPLAQSAGPGMMFSKPSFFLPKRGPGGGKVAVPKVEEKPAFNFNHSSSQFQPQRRFVYDKLTGEAYAEWMNGVAVCIHTGQELFRSRRIENSEAEDGGGEGFVQQPFDYSVPKQRHPNDYSIITDEILASGFITLDDFKAPNGAAIRLRDYEAFLLRKGA